MWRRRAAQGSRVVWSLAAGLLSAAGGFGLVSALVGGRFWQWVQFGVMAVPSVVAILVIWRALRGTRPLLTIGWRGGLATVVAVFAMELLVVSPAVMFAVAALLIVLCVVAKVLEAVAAESPGVSKESLPE